MSFDPSSIYTPSRINLLYGGSVVWTGIGHHWAFEIETSPTIMRAIANFAATIAIIAVFIALYIWFGTTFDEPLRNLRHALYAEHSQNSKWDWIGHHNFARIPEYIITGLFGIGFIAVCWWTLPRIWGSALTVRVTDTDIYINEKTRVPLNRFNGFGVVDSSQYYGRTFAIVGIEVDGQAHSLKRMMYAEGAQDCLMWANNAIASSARAVKQGGGGIGRVPTTHKAPPPKPKRKRFVDR